MKVAITGAAGLFGGGLVRVFSSRHTVFPLTRPDADVTSPTKSARSFGNSGRRSSSIRQECPTSTPVKATRRRPS